MQKRKTFFSTVEKSYRQQIKCQCKVVFYVEENEKMTKNHMAWKIRYKNVGKLPNWKCTPSSA